MTILRKTELKASQKGTILTAETKVIKFQELWDNYPKETVKHIDPESGEDIFSDHCAIHLSEAFYKCGIANKSFKGDRCWRCPHNKNVHIFRAQEFATWLKKCPFPGCPKPKELTGENFEQNVNGKMGIIFFKDYWQRDKEKGTKNRSGDHIDLWEKNKLRSLGEWGVASYVVTQGRLTFSEFFEEHLSMSDLKRSSEVLFWEMK